MKRLLLFLLLLLVPASASAQAAFDLSCGNVLDIVIIRGEDTFLTQRSPDGIVHSVTFRLKPEALGAFQTFVEASRQAMLSRDAGPQPPYAALTITANGKPLRCDMLEIRGYRGKRVCTFIFKEQDARDPASAVCPTAPVDFIIAPKWHAGAPQ